mmetsp:Transcript_20049/g.47799  ORF Transcript_20049/g.47799 Transcript_20049/m.47799 type:complete len:253 (+) Transcript_20049:272-1030(+)
MASSRCQPLRALALELDLGRGAGTEKFFDAAHLAQLRRETDGCEPLVAGGVEVAACFDQDARSDLTAVVACEQEGGKAVESDRVHVGTGQCELADTLVFPGPRCDCHGRYATVGRPVQYCASGSQYADAVRMALLGSDEDRRDRILSLRRAELRGSVGVDGGVYGPCFHHSGGVDGDARGEERAELVREADGPRHEHWRRLNLSCVHVCPDLYEKLQTLDIAFLCCDEHRCGLALGRRIEVRLRSEQVLEHV